MSLNDRQSRLFLEPLSGKATAFRLSDRQTNLRFGAALLRLLAAEGLGARLLDMDAFYSSNADIITRGIPPERLAAFDFVVPEPGSDMEAALAATFRTADKPVIVDSANTVYQFLSTGNPRAATRKFGFFVSALSSWARTNGRPAFASIYDRRPAIRRRQSRSLADVFDNSVSLTTKPEGLSFRCERGSAWRGGGFLLSAL